jgi:hypothetical protein
VGQHTDEKLPKRANVLVGHLLARRKSPEPALVGSELVPFDWRDRAVRAPDEQEVPVVGDENLTVPFKITPDLLAASDFLDFLPETLHLHGSTGWELRGPILTVAIVAPKLVRGKQASIRSSSSPVPGVDHGTHARGEAFSG